MSGDKPAGPGISTTPPNASASVTGAPDAAKPASAPNGSYIGSPLKKQRADEPGSGENPLRSRIGSEISSSVSEILGSGSGGESKNGGAASRRFGDSLEPKESGSAQQDMEEEL